MDTVMDKAKICTCGEVILRDGGDWARDGVAHRAEAPCYHLDGSGAPDLSPDVRETLEAVADALAAAIAPLAGKVEQARSIAADLEAELHVCREHLRAVLPLVTTTWAVDTRAAGDAVAYLEGEDDA